MHVTSMPLDPLAADFGEGINKVKPEELANFSTGAYCDIEGARPYFILAMGKLRKVGGRPRVGFCSPMLKSRTRWNA